MHQHIIQKLWLVALLVVGLSQTAGAAGERRMSATYRDTPLATALKDIGQKTQTRVEFAYGDVEHLRVTEQIKNATAFEAVIRVLAPTPLTVKRVGKFLVVKRKPTAGAASQEGTLLRGRVSDEQGEPLPGVSVATEDHTMGIVTDRHGEFAIMLPTGKTTLLFSFLGMKTEKLTLDASDADRICHVTLRYDSHQIDDVVVTGYQTISKERATGAYSIINANDLEMRPTQNIANVLNGMVAGLSVQDAPVGGSTRFLIRGKGTLQETQDDSDPLIVVDGFAISNYTTGNDPFESINPDDVESITVLKDAAATSIYGARAANGVIVVTTKKGKKSGKLDISADANWSIGSRPDLDYFFNMASAESQIRYVELMNRYNPISMTGRNDPYTSPSAQRTGYMSEPYTMLFERDTKGHLSAADYAARRAQLIALGNEEVWKRDLNKYVFRHSLRSQYNVSLRGNSERANYSFSASYNDEDGYSKGDERQRILLNLSLGTTLAKGLTFDASVQTTFSRKLNNTAETKPYISPWTRLVDDEGNYTHVPTASTIYQPVLDSEQWYAGRTVADWHYNPVADRDHVNRSSKAVNYRVQGGFNYSAPFGLRLSARGQYERTRNTTRNDWDPESFRVRDLRNTYSTLNAATGLYDSYFPAGGIFYTSGNLYEAYNLRGQADYSHTWGRHGLTALAGTEIISATTDTDPAIMRYGYNAYTNSVLTAPDYVQNVTDIFGQIKQPPYEPLGTLSTREDRYFSVYGNAAYTYDDRYSLTVSFRTDASNFQSKKQRDKFSPFWSVGGSWMASRERFMSEVKWIDMLKLRASVGIAGVAAGKSGTSSVTTLSVGAGHPQFTHNESFNGIAARGNETLTWEKSRTLNIGLDASLFSHRLTASMEFYNKFSYDVLSLATVPAISQGVTKATFNNAEVVNRGVELSLGTDLRIVGDLRWKATLNYAYNYNKVETYNVNTAYSPFNHGYVAGYPTDFVLALDPVGYTPEGFIVLQGKDGEQAVLKDSASGHLNDKIYRNLGQGVDDNNWYSYLGATAPTSNASLMSQFTWRGLTLSIMLTGRFGYWVARNDYFGSRFNEATFSRQLDQAFRVLDEGYAAQTRYSALPLMTDANAAVYGRNYYELQNASLVMRNNFEHGDHIRLSEVYLGYDLPKSLLSRQHIFRRICVFAQAKDLGLLWTRSHDMDPDYPIGSLKPMPSFTLGLRINFKN